MSSLRHVHFAENTKVIVPPRIWTIIHDIDDCINRYTPWNIQKIYLIIQSIGKQIQSNVNFVNEAIQHIRTILNKIFERRDPQTNQKEIGIYIERGGYPIYWAEGFILETMLIILLHFNEDKDVLLQQVSETYWKWLAEPDGYVPSYHRQAVVLSHKKNIRF